MNKTIDITDLKNGKDIISFFESDPHSSEIYLRVTNDSENCEFYSLKEYQLPYAEHQTGLGLIEIRWEEKDCMFLTFDSGFCSDDVSKSVKIILGRCDNLPFGDFQIRFSVAREQIIKLLDEKLTLSGLIEIAQVSPDNEWKKYQELRKKYQELNCLTINKEANSALPEHVSLESICFDKDRITKFFDCSLIEKLDFLLTFSINDLVREMQKGENDLKKYLSSTPRISIDKQYQRLYALVYPTDIKEGKSYPLSCFGDKLIFAMNRCHSFLPFSLEYDDKIGFLLDNEPQLEELKNIDKTLQEIEFRYMQHHIGQELPDEIRDVALQFSTTYESFFNLFGSDVLDHSNNISDSFFILFLTSCVGPFTPVIDWTKTQEDNQQSDSCQLINIDKEKKIEVLFPKISEIFKPDLLKKLANSQSEERYQQFLQIYTVLDRFAIRYREYHFIAGAINNLLTCFKHAGKVFLKKELEKYSKDHSANELKEYWKSLYASSEFVYGTYPVYTNRPPKSHQAIYTEILLSKIEQEKRESELKSQTQKEIFVMINHSIKNLMSSIDGSLSRLERRLPPEQEFICNLLKQAKQGIVIASDLANAVSLSYRSSSGEEMWQKDIVSAGPKWSIREILRDALFVAIPHMFYRKYSQYENESQNYFPDQEEMKMAEKNWYDLSDAEERISWINNNLFKIKLKDDSAATCKVGNEISTKTHFFVLFNEILLNAVKAISYMPKDKRYLDVSLVYQDGYICVSISNPALQNYTNSSGCGHIVVDNYRNMFNMKNFHSGYDMKSNCYQVKFSIPFITHSKESEEI